MSPVIQETFLESDWQDEQIARAARDQRVEQLQAQGFVCTCENLYTVFGQRVFLVKADRAQPIDPIDVGSEPTSEQRPSSRPKRSIHPKRAFETR